jgi:2-keto-4-pentenoate hydratase
MGHEPAAEAARILSDAWQDRRRIDDLPPTLKPTTWDEVYRIQDATIGLMGPVSAWKVAPVDRGTGRICVPIPAFLVHESPAIVTARDFAPELEVETGVRIGRDLPDAAAPYTSSQVADAIGSLHVAVEIAGSRFVDRKAVGQMTAVADLGMNAGIVVGPPLTDWRGIELGQLAMDLSVGGTEVGTSAGSWTTAEMLEALAALATHAARRSGGLKAGQVVITGARIGPTPFALDAPIEATAEGFAPVSLVVR